MLKKLFSGIKDIAFCTGYFAKFAWKKLPIYYFYILLSVIVNTAGPFVSIIGSKYLINEIVYEQNRNIGMIIFWVAFICIGTYLYAVVGKFANEKQNYCNDRFDRMLQMEISFNTMQMKFEYTENSEMLDSVNKAGRAFEQTNLIQGLTDGIVGLISNILVLAGVMYIVVNCSVWLLIPVFLSFVINTYMTMKTTKLKENYFSEAMEIDRVVDYYLDELTTGEYAKDIRIYNADNMIIDNQKEQSTKQYNLSKRSMKKIWNNEKISITSTEICNIAVYIILGVNTLTGKITIGDFSSLTQAVIKFTEALYNISKGLMGLKYTASILKYYLDYIEKAEIDIKYEKSKNAEVPNVNDGVSIEFKNVSFKYPNTDVYILKNINTSIHPGEHLSIVGKNGAGKTTFIKLLCRLYEVTEGEILVNGVNINDIEYSKYLDLLSVVFQDYRLMAFSIKDNIDMGQNKYANGDMEQKEYSNVDMEQKEYANGDMEQNTYSNVENKINELCKIVEIDGWINSLENKQNTNLYKMFDESGVEPSGGQAQKLAIVRALYKDAPVVVLDEPTAALDPIAEFEVYNNFDKLVGGKTAVYISHRLSSCRFCDRIIVFDGGTIIEDGSHDKLMENTNGFYFNMYNTQAKHYQN